MGSLQPRNGCFAYEEMNLISLGQSESDRETGVNPNGLACPDEESPACKVPCDSCSLLLGQVARTLVGTERRGGCSSVIIGRIGGECRIGVVVIVWMAQ